MKASLALLAATILSLSITACYSPKTIGDGTIDSANVPPLDRTTSWLHVSNDESYVVCESEGTPDLELFYGSDFLPLRPESESCDVLALSRIKPQAICLSGEKVRYLRLPDFFKQDEVTAPAGSLDSHTKIDPRPGGGYVFTTPKVGHCEVMTLTGDPPAFSKPGETALPGRIRGHALDDSTGDLVLTDDTNRLEIFDTKAMKSVAVITLPCRQVSYGLAAHGGYAFVGTESGGILPVNLQTKKVGAQVHTGGPGDVEFGLSHLGDLLACSSQDRSSRIPPYPTNLKVFRVEGGTLTPISHIFLETEGPVIDLAILASTGKVGISTREHLLVWTYRIQKGE